MKRLMRASGSTCFSAHSPASPCEIRPSGETAVASAITSAAPPTARDQRWTKCQSVAAPYSDEYMHIGETPMRLRSVTERMVSGSKRFGMEARKKLSAERFANSAGKFPRIRSLVIPGQIDLQARVLPDFKHLKHLSRKQKTKQNKHNQHDSHGFDLCG